MIEILVGVLLGVVLGTLSGILPGIHVTTLAGVLLSLQVALLPVIGPLTLAATMFAALITHTFVDSIPTTFLGIPDADTALAVLSAHVLCLEGNGGEAVRIAALGSTCAMIIAVPLSVLCYFFLPSLQPLFDWEIGLILVAVIGYMIVTSEAPWWAFALFGISGILGIFTFRYGFLGWHSIWEVRALLMPLLIGLFGISIDGRSVARSSVLGTLAGVAVGWLPGLSTATANGVLASVIGYEKDRRTYIVATSAANTANAFIGLAALFALSRMRNGVMVALSALPLPPASALFVVWVAAACAAYVITVTLSRSAHRLGGIEGRWMNGAVIAFVVALCLVLTGPFGGFVLQLATLIGLVPHMVNVPRMYCMGAVMMPVMLYSFGIAGI